MVPAAPDPLLGVVLAQRYRIDRKLGEGGMGAVYAATGPGGGAFAVKIIHAHVATRMSSALARFLQEARTASTVDSQNVVPVVDAGTAAELGVPFLVMPLLHGRDVEQVIDEVGALDPTTAVRIALQAARGLGTAHARGIVHRDVKPANLYLDAGAGGEITVKVCDFGIAKVLDPGGDQKLTKTGGMLGSPLYMSPEQAKSAKHVDTRTDVWSLGVTLYTMLTGTAPNVDATSMAELLVRVTTVDPPPVQDLAPWVEPGLAAVVHAAMTRDLERRCPSMHALFTALQPFAAGGEAVTAAMLVGPSDELRRRVAPRPGEEALPAPAAGDPADASRLVGATLGGKYRLGALLGKGGMGAVYQATDAAGQRFAVKVMFGAMTASPNDRRRFVREARASAAIQSPHVVRVVDADTDPAKGVPFLVMELLSGTDLQGLVARVGPVEPTAGVRLLLQACRGLSAAHRTGVVHRDVKPANLFLDTLPDGEVRVKVCDFGIAKTTTEAIDQTSAQLTKTGGMLGSPVYMSPEQAKNAKHVDARTDVWSLCMTMYEAFTGQQPWARCTTIGELILAICTEDVPPLAEAAPWLDQRIADAVQRGLRREAAERWASVDELATALAPLAEGSERLTREMLVGVPPERRSIVSPRISLVAAPAAASTAAGSTSVTLATPAAPRRPVGLFVAAAAVVVIGGGLGASRLLRSAAPVAPAATASASASVTPESSASAAPEPSAAPSAAPAKLTVRVAVRPPGATVSVDGAPRELAEGDLVLEGALGTTVKVVVTTAAGKLEETVRIAEGGVAVPASLEVKAPATPVGKRPVAPGPTPKLKTSWK